MRRSISGLSIRTTVVREKPVVAQGKFTTPRLIAALNGADGQRCKVPVSSPARCADEI